MKTLINYTQKTLVMYKLISLFILLMFISQTISFAENNNINFDLEDEAYVDDIPFDTY